MITIQNAESALKSIYLDGIINDINTKTNPFLTMVQNNAKAVNGKEARATIRYGNEGSVASGTEGGALPMNANGKVAEIVSPLKNLYGTFQISDKAIRAASNNASVFSELLASEMQNLIGTAQANLNGMLYGNGKKLICYADAVANDPRLINVPARFAHIFKIGDVVEVYTADNEYLGTLTVSTVDASGRNFGHTGTLTQRAQDRFYLYEVSTEDTELNGIDSIFRQDAIYNLPKATHSAIAPCVVIAPTVANVSLIPVLNEDKIMEFFDAYEEHCQGMPADILLTHPTVRKAVFENLKNIRTNIDVTVLEGGFKGFSFNGIPVYSDIKCKGGTMYAMNSDSWAMHQLCDWTWITGDDGGILKQIDGKAGYSATLVKYADLVCDKPFIQGKVTGYSARRSV